MYFNHPFKIYFVNRGEFESVWFIYIISRVGKKDNALKLGLKNMYKKTSAFVNKKNGRIFFEIISKNEWFLYKKEF